MPLGEFRSWVWLKLARITGNPDWLDNAERRSDSYYTSQLRRAERAHGFRMAQLEGFYFYNALPMLPDKMPEEEAFYGVAKNKCDFTFDNADRCLYTEKERDRRNLRVFHSRLHSCHATWELFLKCVTRRDVHILRNIESWEKYYVKHLNKLEREKYVDIVSEQSNYYDYMYSITDPDKKISCYYEKRQKEFKRRLHKLINVINVLEGRQKIPCLTPIKQSTDLGRDHYAILQH